MTDRNIMKVMTWNARSLGKNKDSLFYFLSQYEQDIIVICETWLKPDFPISTPGYKAFHMYRQDGYGGVSVLFKHFVIVDYISSHDCGTNAQIAKFRCSGINFIVGYIPPNTSFSTNDWSEIITSLEPGPLILMGDFNAIHPMFGSPTSNAKGTSLNDIVELFNLVCMNDGTPTLLTNNPDHANVLDLVLCSSEISHIIDCNTINDTLGSDHFPVQFTLSKHCGKSTFTGPRNKSFNFAKANWNVFAEHIKDSFEAELVTDYNSFISALNQAAINAIPVKKYSMRGNKCPWWDESCTRMVNLRKYLIRQFLNNGSCTSYIIAKRYIALCKKHLLKKKRTSFASFCERLSRDSSFTNIWTTVKRFSNNYQKDNIVTNHNMDWTTDFMSSLCPDYVPSKAEMDPIIVMASDSVIAERFTLQELHLALDTPKKTAPGTNDISFPMLRNIPDAAKEFLLNLFNSVLCGAQIPASWREMSIVPVPKPGRNLDTKEGYRPIALINCDRKILEKMILTRIEWWIERRSLLEPLQFGFRRGMGVPECIFTLVGSIQRAFLRRKVVVALFADIESAYDNVNIPKMLVILGECGIPSNILEMLRQLIAVKNLKLKNDPRKVGSRISFKGLPQGSSLSPLLFNVYLKGLNGIVNPMGVKARRCGIYIRRKFG